MSSDATPPDPPSAPRPGDSLLDTIGRRTGRPTKVTLSDTDADDATPILDPRVQAFQDELRGEDRGKYQVLGEIASGGMGVVLRGHDRELGRDVAMKVVHGELSGRPEVVARFVEEAQIGGQLQHPGIVPVYELGLLADQRPYFTMKLIKGHTLAKLLARRKTLDEDRVRYLTIFGAVCQTMAYAHSKGVIHRDLKPANVMVGSFGEVQVVDWGLSKVLHRGGVADELAAQDEARTIIETVRSGPRAGSDSIVGNVLGTPAYMAPEQAQGNVEQLDERTDVFALGAILCELLTGAPPYVAGEGQNLVQMAALAELADANARIEACSAAPGLKKLCRSCLMPSKQARPASAEELAEAVQTHLSGLESAAHEAQLAAAEERLRAERSRRRLQLTLSAGVVLLLAGGGWWWNDARQRERSAELARGLDAVGSEVTQHERAGRFEQALDAARGGLRLVEAGGADAALRERAEQLITATEALWSAEQTRLAERDREERLLDFLTDVEMRQVGTGIGQSHEELNAEYREAFRAFGLDLDDPELAERVAALRDTELGIRIALGADGWARLLMRMRGDHRSEVELLIGIGLDLDTNALRTEARLALFERDAQKLLALASEDGLEQAEAPTLILLASSLAQLGQPAASRSILVDGADRHPTSFLLNFSAGRALYDLDRNDLSSEGYARALGYLHAAVALRPDLPEACTQLGDAYRAVGNNAMASRWADKAVAMAPEHTWNNTVLAFDRLRLGAVDDAVAWLARDEQGMADPFAESLLRACRVYQGKMSADEYVAWAKALPGSDGQRWIGPAMTLCWPSSGTPDPARVRALLEPFLPFGAPDDGYWMALATACLMTGDAQAALRATARSAAEWSDPGNMHQNAILLLIDAAARRQLGEDLVADARLRLARRLRDELVVGNEAVWRDSMLLRYFARFEPLATGR